MFFEKWTKFFCLVVCVVCLFGIYRLQAQTPERPPPTPPTPQEREVTEPPRTTFSESIDSDFYQTIIRNNLFAPLGTDLHKKPVPGASLKLIATMTTDDPADATAIVQNTATGEQKTVGVGSMFAGYQVLDIQAKQILLEKSGDRAVWKRMTPNVLLN